ncbi:MAG: hypothetical protein ACFE85_15825 [Candidatus Hodarchaeota archaeon]
MKLWIIYKEGIVISKTIAEMIQDRLEDYIEISVGTANKTDPLSLIDEELDYLIIGDIFGEKIPSLEIQNWVLKYSEDSILCNKELQALSGFYVSLTEMENELIWIEFLRKYIKAKLIFPPILCLKLKKSELPLKIGALEIVKDYSNDFIEYLLNRNKKK